jgi:hypothetical protein
MFVCEGDACVAAAPQSTTFASGTCKTIAAKVGPVTSFGGYKSHGRGPASPTATASRWPRTASPQLAKQ